MSDIKSIGSLIDSSIMVIENLNKPFTSDEYKIYKSIDGSLMHLATRTRPDLSVAVSILGSYVHAPITGHMLNAKRKLFICEKPKINRFC